MDKDKTLAILRDYKQAHARELGIRQIGIFGSTARGEAGENSDVDVVVDMDSPNFSAFARIKMELEQMMSVPVDLVRMRKGMNPLLQQCLDEDSIYA